MAVPPPRETRSKILAQLGLDRQFFDQHVNKDAIAKLKQGHSGISDWDLYVGEQLLPLMSQAMDALCRRLTALQQAKAKGRDEQVIRRFNPVTWIAQYIARHHPKGPGITPRRQSMYTKFQEWSDVERGRRELLRQLGLMKSSFRGFILGDRVRVADLQKVLKDVDEALGLRGKLATNRLLLQGLTRPSPSAKKGNRTKPVFRTRTIGTDEAAVTFDEFWDRFTEVVTTEDILKYSELQEGQLRIQQQKQRMELEEAERLEREAQRAQEAEERRRQLLQYEELSKRVEADPEIKRMLANEELFMSGDEGAENRSDEVSPFGDHVLLLRELLEILGFGEKELGLLLEDPAEDSDSDSKASEPTVDYQASYHWDEACCTAWGMVQDALGCEFGDGCVDQRSLQAVLVPAAQFTDMKATLQEEVQRRRAEVGMKAKVKSQLLVEESSASTKPPLGLLCKTYGFTMARLDWLHEQFQLCLPEGVRDDYPTQPAALKLSEMMDLMRDLMPGVADDKIEERFREIDQDGSNQIEFDEFVMWLCMDQIDMGDGDPAEKAEKPGFAELARRFHVPEQQVRVLHEMFEGFLPGGGPDRYPEEPQTLPRDNVLALMRKMVPALTDEQFEAQFAFVDINTSGGLEFDEFLEICDIKPVPGH
mmetsp:Transcript_8176/g.17839  ORF Transcript_8176/g.17839 Transcript_8176/m.17839 type:complete len:650 (+) Transcript_8176:33-1982(+)|eukprot:CAMPEP_0204286104 /NCGR_PEP_ID=MMETSP0468-20130131/52077_1 /ASSEMBLY_ACC=CAM_ASM_000383 /TAXON_ID=2969 /ORGANISM="Oxyrrhis marina" /LENGTH=649 /DNA_ID=CAMNT_0051263989 /DNA_START=13 /DNA_END=1962 /DNA_ORIENTATION=-